MGNSQSSNTVWNDTLLTNPHAVSDKRLRVQRMFAAIAPSYDLNNRLHSLWMDQRWRRRAVEIARLQPTDSILDVACGTGDLTIAFAEAMTAMAPCPRIIGLDFTFEMLPLARKKVIDLGQRHQSRSHPLCNSKILWINGDAMALPLADACVDVISIAFGIRNVSDAAAAIREFYRVLRPGGRLLILEFSLPANPILRGIYNLYFRHILPRTATLISRDQTGAYKYLPESVNTFISRDRMLAAMTGAGFANVQHFCMTFGVCICYRAEKQPQ
jgi:demethylmenaquinone methyltransferase/2-methoxy-6-polyprenyl-1,4-benzoquinol methylase